MSIKLIAAVFDLPLPPTEKLVLLAMADHANDDGRSCYPSVDRLCHKTSLSRRGLQKIIRRLEHSGRLKPIGSTSQGVIEYQINTSGGEPYSPREPRSLRTVFAGGANLNASRGEPRSPEPSLTVNEPSLKPRREKTAPDPRHKPFLDLAYQAFQMKHLQPPTWGPKHYEGLRLFLAKHPHVTIEEWQRRYQFLLASTDPFYRQQKGSLAYFVGNFDRFIDGPILEKAGNWVNRKVDIGRSAAAKQELIRPELEALPWKK